MEQEKTQSLYHVNEDYISIITEIENAEGEITPEQDKALSINKAELEEKTESYIEAINRKEAYIDRISKELERLGKVKKRQQSSIDRMKGKLIDAVTIFGEYDAGLYSVKTQDSKSVSILDESKIPKQFIVTEEKSKIDKTAIKKAINDGELVNGAVITVNKNLKIK